MKKKRIGARSNSAGTELENDVAYYAGRKGFSEHMIFEASLGEVRCKL
jgi:hypothetical protein